jgi:hypothetical protein
MSSTTTEERQVLSAVYDYCSKKNDEVFKFKHSDLVDNDGRLLRYIVRKLKGRCGPEDGKELTQKVFRLLDGSLAEKKFIKKKEDGDYKMMTTRVKEVCVIVVVL